MDDASCQTFGESWKEVQTLQDQYQQTERRDYYLTQKYDKILHPKLYASTDFIERQKIKAVNQLGGMKRKISAVLLIF